VAGRKKPARHRVRRPLPNGAVEAPAHGIQNSFFDFDSDGKDRIRDTGGFDAIDTKDSSARELSFRRSGDAPIIEKDGTSGQITVVQHFSPTPTTRIEHFRATDGTWALENTTLGTATDDILVGGSTDDQIHGSGGNDLIFGGGRNDTLTGADGDDILCGGDGDDTYAMTPMR